MAKISRQSKSYKIYILVIIAIVIGLVFSLGVGSVYIPPGKISKILFSKLPFFSGRLTKNWSITDEAIVLQFRLSRVILAFLVGAQLSAAGVIYQGIFRNPMADPYIIGASAGASLGAALGILFFPGLKILGIGSTPFFAFIGSAGTVFLVYSLASIGGRTYSFTLLLAGVAVSSFLSAMV
ncbi:MAG: iron chelate uptake ABC transporter family permease subunit, partial [Thermoanaerobacteraceae bacterium]|nr:iron chelate uptake ABC transporter family permease subunit [Thermoanaerobacteraceae bacterium]